MPIRLDRLSDSVELLDGPLDDPAALAGNLRDLGRINRWLGGVALSAAAIDLLAPGRSELTLLDIGTGGADIPAALVRRAERRHQQLRIVGIDSRPEIVAAARQATARWATADVGRLELLVGDGRSLAFPDAAFDVAHASLVLHHQERPAAVELLREMARVARLGVVVNDLERSRLGWAGAWLLGHVLTGNAYTRTDAPLSVRRAYRAPEMHELLIEAGLGPLRTFRSAFGLRYAIAARVAPRASGA